MSSWHGCTEGVGIMRRVLLILLAALAFAGGSARAESLCVSAGATVPGPGGHPTSIVLGPYCVTIP